MDCSDESWILEYYKNNPLNDDNLICKSTVQGVDRMIGMFIDELDKGYTYTEKSIDLAKVRLGMLKNMVENAFCAINAYENKVKQQSDQELNK